jgi:pyruvate/2-oxoglutarate/acetoin dehydrogenase E1 component
VKTLKYRQAIIEALREEMEQDESVCILGEDVAIGGVFLATRGLVDQFGRDRVRDTPICEAGFTGISVGAAMFGLRPVVEIQFFDFILLALDQIINHGAKMRFMSGGQHRVPLTIRAPSGARMEAGGVHSQTYEVLLSNIPGLHVVCPSTPADVKGLLKSAIRSDDPVIVIESYNLYRMEGDVPDGDHMVELGKANVVCEGSDVTIVGVGSIMPTIIDAVGMLASDGISCEVVDLRSLAPLDWDTLIASANKTGRLVVAQDGPPHLGLGAAVVGHLSGPLFGKLRSAPKIVAPPHCPVPGPGPSMQIYYPDAESIERTVRIALE